MMRILILSLTMLLSIQLLGNAQSNDDCLLCHSDPDMTMEKGRHTISLWVNNSKFIFSAHKKLNCVSCHKGFDPDEMPHKANIQPVDCKSCHTDALSKHTFHPTMESAPLKDNCKQCHGYHEVSSPKGANSSVGGLNAVDKCGACHPDVKEEYVKSEHFKAVQTKQSANAPDCNYCHRNPITKGWIKNYKERKVNQNAVCVECHKSDSHNPDVLKKISNNDSRHAKLRKSGKEYAAVCTDCHGFHNVRKNDDFEAALNAKNSSSACGKCHIHIAQEYQNSIHGIAQMKGNANAAGCVSCHHEHSKENNPKVDDGIYTANNLNKEFAEKSNTVVCINCHTNDNLIQESKLNTLSQAHKWLPGLDKHFQTVSCFECHASYTEPYLSHNILPLEKSRRDCNECHDKTLELKSVLYKYSKSSAVEKAGYFEGNISGDANYVGLASNIILDYLSLILLGGIILGLIIHAYIRWYFKKGKVN